MDPRTTLARELMMRFAERTGLVGDGPPRRYLWTDAFAVCNLLGLGERALALHVVEHVHRTLGRHRPDDTRTGWISGLDEQAGAAHPTIGGLRIGKPLPERGAAERFDDRLEWDRDGQYFHYLTKWMHALDQIARATGDAAFAIWARELASAAHRAFRPAGARRMAWKLSIDLSRPLVPSMGQHDPLDGFVTSVQLGLPALAADYAEMIDPPALATDDPLGLGGLLADAYRLDQLGGHDALRDALLAAAARGLRSFAEQPLLHAPVERRLAFRELGLAIGLAAPLAPLARHAPLRAAIEQVWTDPASRRAASWRDHADINDVMLATCLAPEGFLVLAGPALATSPIA